MPVSEEIERLAVTHGSATDIRRVAIAEGMVTLREDGLRKTAAGLTTVEEILRVTV
jgi:type IV pilus assembly protein PilB